MKCYKFTYTSIQTKKNGTYCKQKLQMCHALRAFNNPIRDFWSKHPNCNFALSNNHCSFDYDIREDYYKDECRDYIYDSSFGYKWCKNIRKCGNHVCHSERLVDKDNCLTCNLEMFKKIRKEYKKMKKDREKFINNEMNKTRLCKDVLSVIKYY